LIEAVKSRADSALHPLARYLLAAASGAILSLAFPPIGFGWTVLPGTVLLLALVITSSLRQALIVSFVAAAVFFLLLLRWLSVVGEDAWILLSIVCAGYFVAMGAAIWLLSRFRLWPIWVAGAWVAQEWLRGTFPFGGFPWGNLAFSQVDTSFGRLSMVTGALATSGLVVLCAGALIAGWQGLRAGERRVAAGWLLGALGLVVLPLLLQPPTTGDLVGGAATASVGVVQGGTPQTGLGAMDVRRAVLDNHTRQTMTLARDVALGTVPKPDFVLWPENASDLDPNVDEAAAAAIGTSVRAMNVPVLVGAIVNVPGDPSSVWNQGILWDPVSGPGQTYSKTHPVPFGEYLPFRSVLAHLIDRFQRISRDFAAGDAPGLFDISGVDVGDVICFEIAYNAVIDPLIDGGARLLTVQTNNATYGDTSQPSQQLQIERFRALETGRSVAVAATTGVSAFILPDGTILRQLDQGQVGTMVESVPLRGSKNPSAFLGRPMAALWALSSVLLMIYVAARAFAARRSGRRRVAR